LQSGISERNTDTDYQATENNSESIMQIMAMGINNDCSITKNELKSLENTEFSCQK